MAVGGSAQVGERESARASRRVENATQGEARGVKRAASSSERRLEVADESLRQAAVWRRPRSVLGCYLDKDGTGGRGFGCGRRQREVWRVATDSE